MFYMALLPVLALSCWTIIHLRRLAKHDRVLFEFCQIRREIMTIFRRELFEMDKKKYLGLKKLLDSTSSSIHYYNDNKTTMFDFRKFAQWLRDSRISAMAIEGLKLPNDPEILKIREHFGMAMVSAFCAYTPFLRSEASIRFSMFFLRTATRAGWRRAENVFQFAEWFKDFSLAVRGSDRILCRR